MTTVSLNVADLNQSCPDPTDGGGVREDCLEEALGTVSCNGC